MKAWAAGHVATFCKEYFPSSPVKAADTAAGGVSAVDADPPAAETERHRYLWSNPLTRRIIQACMHRFSAEGAHIDFYKTKEIQARVKQHLMLSEDVPYQTAHVWRTKEMEVSAQRGNDFESEFNKMPRCRHTTQFLEARLVS